MLQLGNILDLSVTRSCSQDTDEITSEIWIAGGNKLAELLNGLMRRVVVNGPIPPQGSLARLYKRERWRCRLQLASWDVDC